MAWPQIHNTRKGIFWPGPWFILRPVTPYTVTFSLHIWAVADPIGGLWGRPPLPLLVQNFFQ